MVENARKLMRKRRTVRLVVFVVVLAVGSVVGQLVREWFALKGAEGLKSEGKLLQAANRLKGFQYPIFLGPMMERAQRSYSLAYCLKRAAEARAAGNYGEAIDFYKKARSYTDFEDKTIEGGINLTQYLRLAAEAEALGNADRWAESVSKWYEAVELAKAFELLKEKRDAELSLELARLISGAFQAEADGRHESARDYWLRAHRLNKDHPAVKKNLLRLGIEP
jgi:tetratricopeptide (TPR) repeat protein